MEAEHGKPGGSSGSGSIRKAIEQVDHIRSELKKVLEEMHEVLRTLEQVEREKTASEEEIELLRESLRLLHRDPGHPRHLRSSPPRPAPTIDHAPPEEEPEQEPGQAS